MNKERIKEIQLETAYPNSVSVQQALMKVWNECEQQSERMYSEEEVKHIIDATLIEHSDFVLADIPEWFEQFKKK
jgi:hypothetical protein